MLFSIRRACFKGNSIKKTDRSQVLQKSIKLLYDSAGPLLFGLSSAIETRIFRPSMSFPFSPAIAFSAHRSSGISTNPNPFESPLVLSFMIVAEVTSPNSENFSVRISSVVLKLRLPMYILFI